jgi:hypothetical protein
VDLEAACTWRYYGGRPIGSNLHGIAIVRLPEDVGAFMLHKSSGGQNCDTTGTLVTWDTQDYLASGYWTHSTGTNPERIACAKTGDFYALSGMSNNRSSGTIYRYNNIFTWMVGTGVYLQSEFGMYNRMVGADYGCNGGFIGAITASDYLSISMKDESTSSTEDPYLIDDQHGIAGIYLDDLWDFEEGSGPLVNGGLVDNGLAVADGGLVS